MKKISYVSNLALSESSGGWSGINRNLHEELSRHFELDYIGPINPSFIFQEKVVSKLKRTIGLKGSFAFFSEDRLKNIEQEFKNQNKSENDAHFFFGNTPWIKIYPTKPYFVYMDADFITYLKVFSDYSKFSEFDINRIANQEKTWLENAEIIFFGSNWIKDETIRNLDLPERKNKYIVVNTGGHIPIPEKDTYSYKKDELSLLFIALNFEKKGGFDAVDIFLECKKNISKVKLTIIGERPPQHVLDIKGIEYLGRLSKSKPNELKKMEETFQNASFLIHPTKMDTMGAIIPEANYFGTPVFASNKFGIPDLILDGKTGILINNNDSIIDIASKVSLIFKDQVRYMNLRECARTYSVEKFSWDAIGKRIAKSIQGI